MAKKKFNPFTRKLDFIGGTGSSGVDGSQWFTDTGVPSSGLGDDKDFYLDSVNGDYYEKIAGTWILQGNLKGSQGIAGTNGLDGNTVLNGTIVPTTEGVDGDFFIRTDTNEIYGPKTGGSWGSPTSLIGPQGIQGIQGDPGNAGVDATLEVQEDDATVVLSPTTILNFEGDVNVIDEGGGKATISINPTLPIFGNEFQFLENNIVTTVTLTTYFNKINFDTASLIGGDYLIGWYYGWNSDSKKDNFDAIVILDNDTNPDNLISSNFIKSHDDAGIGAGRYSNTGTDQLFSENGNRIFTLSPGVHNIKLEFRTSNSGKKMSVWDAVLFIYRVN